MGNSNSISKEQNETKTNDVSLLDQVVEDHEVEQYKALVKRAVDGEKVEFNINTQDPTKAMRQLAALKQAYKAIVNDRTESGFFGFLGRAVPALGSIYAVCDRNTIVREARVANEFNELCGRVLTLCMQKIDRLENAIGEMRQEMQAGNAEVLKQIGALANSMGNQVGKANAR